MSTRSAVREFRLVPPAGLSQQQIDAGRYAHLVTLGLVSDRMYVFADSEGKRLPAPEMFLEREGGNIISLATIRPGLTIHSHRGPAEVFGDKVTCYCITFDDGWKMEIATMKAK